MGRLKLTIKELDIVPSGEKLWQPGNNRPLEKIDIAPEVRKRGYIPVGKLTIETSISPRKFKNAKGYFLKKYEFPNERGKPVFAKDAVALPLISIK
jgi:hypothetical protein